MNTSKMYFNKFSSGTILALLALSGMLFLVPLAAPVHASNAASPVVKVTSNNPIVGGTGTWVELSLTNPTSNQYALQAVTITAPTGWTISACSWFDAYTVNCAAGGSSATFYWVYQESNSPLTPGATALPEIYVTSATGVYPLTGTFTLSVQDQSSDSFYSGGSFNIQAIDSTTQVGLTVTPGGSNTASTYTAGSTPYSITAAVTCTVSSTCPTGQENGVDIQWTASYGAGTVYSFTPSSGFTSGTGVTSTTFQPSNIVLGGVAEVTATVGTCSITGCTQSTGDITTQAGAPTSISFFLGTPTTPFPTTDYLTTQGETTNSNTAGRFTGAEISNTTTSVYVSAADRFGNPDSFGTGSTLGKVDGGTITIQTASGAVFDQSGLPSSISIANPGANSDVKIPDNYYQSGAYASAGVLTATISGATYNGNPLSVSGSSGTIQTSTFATSGSFDTTNHVALGATTVVAGKSLTFEYVLGVAQTGVPVTIAICPNATCGTTKGYTGSITTATGVTNSSGAFSTKLTVDTTAKTAAYLNATVLAPINGNTKNYFVTQSPDNVTTIAGAAAKFTVVVGPTAMLIPSPITNSVPGATVYVNVVTSDAYGNPVSTVGSEQVQVNLVANPSTITVTSAYIPTSCYETNGTDGNGCTGTNSFGPIAWTLPTTVGSTATITASGVLGGVTVTSATTTITIVSKLPTWSLFSPAATTGVVYSSSVNLQFRGWANVSAGYNSICPSMSACSDTMSSLGWQIGSGTWQSTGLSGTNDQWSVVATLPTGLDSITFNATDTKGNTVVSSPYSVLVDTQAPVITDTTTAGANLTAGQLFQASIVSDQGDLNASSVTVQYNGTTLASSAVTVSGTNDNGHSVTYTLTASLPTGHWNVQVSATSLAGLTGTSTSELVTVFVAPGNSVTFNTSGATYGAVGAYSGVTVSVTNSWSTSQTIVVFATLKSGTSIYVAQGTVTLGAGQTQSVFLADLLPVPAGSYTVTFAAVTTDNLPVSAPTTPITVTVA